MEKNIVEIIIRGITDTKKKRHIRVIYQIKGQTAFKEAFATDGTRAVEKGPAMAAIETTGKYKGYIKLYV